MDLTISVGSGIGTIEIEDDKTDNNSNLYLNTHNNSNPDDNRDNTDSNSNSDDNRDNDTDNPNNHNTDIIDNNTTKRKRNNCYQLFMQKNDLSIFLV